MAEMIGAVQPVPQRPSIIAMPPAPPVLSIKAAPPAAQGKQEQSADCSHHLSIGPLFPYGRVYNVCWSDVVFYSLGIALVLWGASLVILGATVGSLKAALS